jgi:prepilin-type N-terminal cleavage/methylation domain-containing protein
VKKAQFVNRARKGFTLLEALFAVLIIAVLAAVAIPMYSNTKAASASQTCINNIKSIATAECKYKFENGSYDTTTETTSLINHGLAEWPTCPGGGTYSVSATNVVACSTHTGATHTVTLP